MAHSVRIVDAVLPREHKVESRQESLILQHRNMVVHLLQERCLTGRPLDNLLSLLTASHSLLVLSDVVLLVLECSQVGLVELSVEGPIVAHQHLIADLVEEGNDAILRGDDVGLDTLEIGEPICESLGFVNRGRQKDKLNGGRQQNETLLPHLPARGVVDIVNLVKHNRIDILQREVCRDAEALCTPSLLIQQIAQDLSGKNDNVRLRRELDVAGHDTDTGVNLLEVVELLVGEGLDGSRIEDSLPLG